jgi:hypothetical protein
MEGDPMSHIIYSGVGSLFPNRHVKLLICFSEKIIPNSLLPEDTGILKNFQEKLFRFGR